MYVPSSKTWYFVKEGQFHGVFKDAVENELSWACIGMLDKVCCMYPYSGYYKLDLLNLKTKMSVPMFSSIKYNDEVSELLTNMEFSQDIELCIVADDNTLYLIMTVVYENYEDEDSEDNKYFKCFRLNPDNTWHHVFSTLVFDDGDLTNGTIYGAVSSESNEMLLLYSIRMPTTGIDDQLFAFVADLGTSESENANVIQLTAGIHIPCTWHILQDKKRFYIMAQKCLPASMINRTWAICSNFKQV